MSLDPGTPATGRRIIIGAYVTAHYAATPDRPAESVVLAPGKEATVVQVEHRQFADVLTVQTDAGGTAEVVSLWVTEVDK